MKALARVVSLTSPLSENRTVVWYVVTLLDISLKELCCLSHSSLSLPLPEMFTVGTFCWKYTPCLKFEFDMMFQIWPTNLLNFLLSKLLALRNLCRTSAAFQMSI